jgi:HSP20 family protein
MIRMGSTVIAVAGFSRHRKERTMTMIKWRRPGEDLARVERRMRRLFEEPFGLDLFTEGMGWMPPVEVVETDTSIEVTAELPGMAKEDVDINLQNNVLTIRGEKREEKTETEREPFLYERYYGSFQRAFNLPAPVEEGKVKAEFRNGVLKIHLPKTATAKGRKISITE